MTQSKKKDDAPANKPEKGLEAVKADTGAARADNRPVMSFSLKGVRVSVFANPVKIDGRDVVMHKAVVTKTYKDGDEWKSTHSLGRDDVPVAVMLLEDAYRWVLERESQTGAGRTIGGAKIQSGEE
jgi:hypothetical protein